ncbi:23S rRNA (adenine(1618)-N(6))-methyltransferase RlmF [Undibacterium terreum]|uniref:Ribosomal RNA large subunit methyltransferase F n=1 Tax=Undibacterium terreum TaxID=1224302 RepID=A0A916U7K4_9BURK|nr:23S rRNA (adenine(1618)-N(6))-methyltransferase RlmF [Undibacterium terreum]GGC62100.1 ribosomal RNA large subunit methyltransferase F [Undibacterium terreum]
MPPAAPRKTKPATAITAAINVTTGGAALHPRNRHQGRYDFARLAAVDEELAQSLMTNPVGEQTINFSDAAAVKALNRALLKDSYGIQGWDIPADYLCPPIPGRADYLHYLADLLAESNAGKRGAIPRGSSVHVLDVGVGANCIYPLIGHHEYGWQFTGTDINPASLDNANKVLGANTGLQEAISLRLQTSSTSIFKGIVMDDEWFDLSLCNPPFHASAAEASAGTQRKWQNLGKSAEASGALNFGGQNAELWCAGGEESFITRMIQESAQIPTRILWFSTLVSKSASLPGIYAALKKVGVQNSKTIAMSQGQKQSRLVAWTFLNSTQKAAWAKLRWK